MKCPVEICEERDVKGLYRKARQGIVKNFTAVTDPYEEPEYPEIVIETHNMTVEKCTDKIMIYIQDKLFR